MLAPVTAPQVKVGRAGTFGAPLAGAVNEAAAGFPAAIVTTASPVWVIGPAAVPVIVTVEVPGTTAPVLPRVRTLLPPGVTGLTEKFTVAPAGTPEVESVTGRAKALNDGTLRLTTAFAGAQISCAAGDGRTRKSVDSAIVSVQTSGLLPPPSLARSSDQTSTAAEADWV